MIEASTIRSPSTPSILSFEINLDMRIVDTHLAGGDPLGRVVSASVGADFRPQHLVHALERDLHATPRTAFDGCRFMMSLPVFSAGSGADMAKAEYCLWSGKTLQQHRFKRDKGRIWHHNLGKDRPRPFPKPSCIDTYRSQPKARARVCLLRSLQTGLIDALRRWRLVSAATFEKAAQRFIAGWSSPVARQAHNLKVASSNLAPATKHRQARPASRPGPCIATQTSAMDRASESVQSPKRLLATQTFPRRLGLFPAVTRCDSSAPDWLKPSS
jgi:hypothetical protein